MVVEAGHYEKEKTSIHVNGTHIAGSGMPRRLQHSHDEYHTEINFCMAFYYMKRVSIYPSMNDLVVTLVQNEFESFALMMCIALGKGSVLYIPFRLPSCAQRM